MTTFTDGHANGLVLVLSRSPLLLRVVMHMENGKPVWDALDQLDDEPKAEEYIWVYRLEGKPGFAHVDFRDKDGRRCGRNVATASYRINPEQPSEQVARDTARWREWCQQHVFNTIRIMQLESKSAPPAPATGDTPSLFTSQDF